MASKFDTTKPVIRDHDIEGYPCRIQIDGKGVHFQRKGDRHRDKPTVTVSWSDIAELGAERAGLSFYEHLKFDE